MKLELIGKFIKNIEYKLPKKAPDKIEYEVHFNLEMNYIKEEDNVISAVFKCSLFDEKENITFNFKYVFFFKHDEKNIIEKKEKELAHNLFLICVPYISEFIDYIISKSPLPPLNIPNTELSD